MKKRRNQLSARERRPLCLPDDIVGGGPFVELRGRREVSVQGCRRILCCEADLVRLALAVGTLEVRGQGLSCTTYFAGAVSIRGVIDGVAFGAGEGSGR